MSKYEKRTRIEFGYRWSHRARREWCPWRGSRRR